MGSSTTAIKSTDSSYGGSDGRNLGMKYIIVLRHFWILDVSLTSCFGCGHPTAYRVMRDQSNEFLGKEIRIVMVLFSHNKSHNALFMEVKRCYICNY